MSEEQKAHFTGRLIKSKDHEQPFYFDGTEFRTLDGSLRFDTIRSDGDYFVEPTFIKDYVSSIESQLSQKDAENEQLRKEIDCELERNASYFEDAQILARDNTKLKAEIAELKAALKELLDGVRELPPLTAIEGMLTKQCSRAKQLLGEK